MVFYPRIEPDINIEDQNVYYDDSPSPSVIEGLFSDNIGNIGQVSPSVSGLTKTPNVTENMTQSQEELAALELEQKKQALDDMRRQSQQAIFENAKQRALEEELKNKQLAQEASKGSLFKTSTPTVEKPDFWGQVAQNVGGQLEGYQDGSPTAWTNFLRTAAKGYAPQYGEVLEGEVKQQREDALYKQKLSDILAGEERKEARGIKKEKRDLFGKMTLEDYKSQLKTDSPMSDVKLRHGYKVTQDLQNNATFKLFSDGLSAAQGIEATLDADSIYTLQLAVRQLIRASGDKRISNQDVDGFLSSGRIDHKLRRKLEQSFISGKLDKFSEAEANKVADAMKSFNSKMMRRHIDSGLETLGALKFDTDTSKALLKPLYSKYGLGKEEVSKIPTSIEDAEKILNRKLTPEEKEYFKKG